MNWIDKKMLYHQWRKTLDVFIYQLIAIITGRNLVFSIFRSLSCLYGGLFVVQVQGNLLSTNISDLLLLLTWNVKHVLWVAAVQVTEGRGKGLNVANWLFLTNTKHKVFIMCALSKLYKLDEMYCILQFLPMFCFGLLACRDFLVLRSGLFSWFEFISSWKADVNNRCSLRF